MLPKTLPSYIGENMNDINKFVTESIINSADKSIPIYEQNKFCHKKLPTYILELIKLKKKNKKFRKA